MPFFRARWIRGWRSRQETAFSAPGTLLILSHTILYTVVSVLGRLNLCDSCCKSDADKGIHTHHPVGGNREGRVSAVICTVQDSPYTSFSRHAPASFVVWFPDPSSPRPLGRVWEPNYLQSQSRSQSTVGRAAGHWFCVWAWLSPPESSRNPRVELGPLGSAWGWDGRQQREGTVELLQAADMLSMFGCAMNPVWSSGFTAAQFRLLQAEVGRSIGVHFVTDLQFAPKLWMWLYVTFTEPCRTVIFHYDVIMMS